MNQKITALQVHVEISVFNDEGKLVSRARPELVAFEADIPETVLQWVAAQLAKGGA